MTRLLAGLIDRLHAAALTRTDWLTGDPANPTEEGHR